MQQSSLVVLSLFSVNFVLECSVQELSVKLQRSVFATPAVLLPPIVEGCVVNEMKYSTNWCTDKSETVVQKYFFPMLSQPVLSGSE